MNSLEGLENQKNVCRLSLINEKNLENLEKNGKIKHVDMCSERYNQNHFKKPIFSN